MQKNVVRWEGALNTATLELVETAAPFGYLPMRDLPFVVDPIVCSETCDDAAITVESFIDIEYMGQTYTNVQVSSNGFISLGTSSGQVTEYRPQSLPGASEPNNVIAPYWTDLDLDGTADDTGTGTMYAATLNTSTNQFLLLSGKRDAVGRHWF